MSSQDMEALKAELQAVKEANVALLDGHATLATAYMARRISDAEDRQRALIARVDIIAKRLDERIFQFERKCERLIEKVGALPEENKQRLDGLTDRVNKASDVVQELKTGKAAK